MIAAVPSVVPVSVQDGGTCVEPLGRPARPYTADGRPRTAAPAPRDLTEPDGVLAEILERPHLGYRLVSWQGTVPDDLAQTFAASRRAMDDMPMEDSDYGTVSWDVERVRATAKAVEQRVDRLHTVVAVDTSTGSVAGFTELVVPGNGTGDGQHYGTGVLPERRAP